MDDGGVRRRGRAQERQQDEGLEGDSFLSASWARRIRKVDVYSKVNPKQESDAQTTTAAGGLLSVLTMSVMAILFLYEMGAYLFPGRVEHLAVDTMKGGQIEISFHMTFPSICCADAHVDAMDVTGEQQVNVLQSILKQRLDSRGYPIGREFVDNDQSPKMFIRMPGVGIMSLVGTDHRIASQRANEEGCSMRGSLIVNKVEGNFHIAVGRSHKSSGHHVHNFKMSDLSFFNTSHIIHSLSFGPAYSGLTKPLDATRQIILPSPSDSPNSIVTGIYQYYLQLTPTTVFRSLGMKTQTYQQSYTKHFQRLDFSANTANVPGMPGIFFMYKLSPFSLRVESDAPGFLHFITNLFAIVGGVLAVSELLNRIFSSASALGGRRRFAKSDSILLN